MPCGALKPSSAKVACCSTTSLNTTHALRGIETVQSAEHKYEYHSGLNTTHALRGIETNNKSNKGLFAGLNTTHALRGIETPDQQKNQYKVCTSKHHPCPAGH